MIIIVWYTYLSG